MFLDRARVTVRGGKGGKGAISFRREAHVPRGGPDGGDGGRGGDLVLRADVELASLGDFQYKHVFAATDGANGEGSNKSGKAGRDVVSETSRIFVATTAFETSCVVSPVTASSDASGAPGLRLVIDRRL